MNGCTHCKHYRERTAEHPKYGPATAVHCAAGHNNELMAWLEENRNVSYVDAPGMLCYQPNAITAVFDRMESNINNLLFYLQHERLSQ